MGAPAADHVLPLATEVLPGAGVWFESDQGTRLIDATSCAGICPFGHRHPAITQAIVRQLGQTGPDQTPAQLAERLLQLAPPTLRQVVVGANDSVTQALRLSADHWQRRGEQRSGFLRFAQCHHRIPAGPSGLTPISVPHADNAQALAEALASAGDSVCALLVEPLAQASGTLQMHPPEYLRQLGELCAQHRVHVIADETVVGLGRTGTLFACEQADLTPDYLCLGPGISGGEIPLSVVLHADGSELEHAPEHAAVKHGLGCAAALAVLDLFENDDVLEHNHELALLMEQRLRPLAELSGVTEVRQTGLIAAVELEPRPGHDGQRGWEAAQHALDHGVALHPLGDVIYFMPPYVIDVEQINLMIDVSAAGIEEAVAS